MSTGMFEGGYVVCASDLDKLQRKFGLAVTERQKFPNPMAAHNLNATRGCPCDGCVHRRTCSHECHGFRTWTEHGDYAARHYTRRKLREAKR